MATEVILPKVDMDMATGTISKWHVKNGDAVKKGQVLFEMETDKSAIEIEAPADGVINNVAANTGAPTAIGAVVAMIYAAGEAVQSSVAPAASPTVIPAKVGIQLPTEAIPAKEDSHFRGNDEIGGTRATPLARRLARQKKLDLSAVKGTGPRGRITAQDIEGHKAIAPTIAPPAPDASATMAMYEAGTYEVKPLDGMRRTIAQRLTLSKQTVPHFYLSAKCDLTQLIMIRERINMQAPLDADKKPKWKLSINDYVIKALALALQRVPAANVTFTDAGILQHRASDVGVAVSVEGGLFTPIVRKAESKSLSQISIEMKDLAARARARKLQSSEYTGGTTAVSNLGMFGIEQFTAIINPPQATILAVGAGVEQFVPVNKLPVLKTLMECTLSCDHRAVDGAVGAELLQAFRAFIEEPALMLA
jgi:pyruvate dehydrogenase E2 component (dihydrolipoamide acetyltransferase)